MVVLLLLSTMAYCIAEELTLTTYYPSPRGVYNELRTRGDVAIGKLDTPSARLEIVGGGATSATSALRIRNVDQSPLLEVQNGGNVGIGTTSPQAELDINGRVRIADGTQGSNKVLTSDASGFASWQTPQPSCPTGYADAGNFCIEQGEHGSANWNAAALTCQQAGGQLCPRAQWSAGCQAGLLTSGATDDWEWVAESYEYGGEWGMRAGNGACSAGAGNYVTATAAYRCCVSK